MLIRLKSNRGLDHRPPRANPDHTSDRRRMGDASKTSDAHTPDRAFELTADDGSRVEIAVFTGLLACNATADTLSPPSAPRLTLPNPGGLLPAGPLGYRPAPRSRFDIVAKVKNTS